MDSLTEQLTASLEVVKVGANAHDMADAVRLWIAAKKAAEALSQLGPDAYPELLLGTQGTVAHLRCFSGACGAPSRATVYFHEGQAPYVIEAVVAMHAGLSVRLQATRPATLQDVGLRGHDGDKTRSLEPFETAARLTHELTPKAVAR